MKSKLLTLVFVAQFFLLSQSIPVLEGYGRLGMSMTGGRSGGGRGNSFLGSSDMKGYETPGAGRTGNTGVLPPGMALIDGELIDMTNKLVQKVGMSGIGTQYYSWLDQNGPPVFRRREIDYGRKFIVFPDRNYFPGDGHYIVLKKLKRTGIATRLGAIYEAFYLDLGDSINALVSNWNTQQYPVSFGPGGVRGGALRGMGMGMRMKRSANFGPPENHGGPDNSGPAGDELPKNYPPRP